MRFLSVLAEQGRALAAARGLLEQLRAKDHRRLDPELADEAAKGW